MDDIELRSKKIRRIIGPIPKRAFAFCIAATAVITVALAIALFCIPNPADSDEKLFWLIIKSLNM